MEVTDERDTTPYWLTSTRRPEELAAALSGVMYEFTDEGKRLKPPSWNSPKTLPANSVDCLGAERHGAQPSGLGAMRFSNCCAGFHPSHSLQNLPVVLTDQLRAVAHHEA